MNKKDIYYGKREWAARRMQENREVEELTDEQHDLLEELSEGRIHFVYMRQSVEHAHTVATKTLLVTWCGQGCATAVKSQFQAIVTALDNYMARFHMVLAAKVAAKTEDELRFGLKEQLWRLSESKQA